MIRKHEKVVHIMKVIYEQALKVSIDLKLNVDEQQDNIKHVKELCDIDEEDEVAKSNIKNKAVLVTYNQTFEMKNGLKIISRKSTLRTTDIIGKKGSEIERK